MHTLKAFLSSYGRTGPDGSRRHYEEIPAHQPLRRYIACHERRSAFRLLWFSTGPSHRNSPATTLSDPLSGGNWRTPRWRGVLASVPALKELFPILRLTVARLAEAVEEAFQVCL